MERLKAFSVEKFTLDGRKFHTLTILSAKYLLRVLLTQLGLYSFRLVSTISLSEIAETKLRTERSLNPKLINSPVDFAGAK